MGGRTKTTKYTVYPMEEISVAVLIDRYLPILGGAQKNVHQLCQGLIDRGWQVTVLTRRLHRDLASTGRIDGVKVHRMGWLPGGGSSAVHFVSKWWCGLWAAWWLYRHRDAIDVVLTVPIGPYSDLLAAHLGWRWAEVPYVIRGSSLGNNFRRMLGPAQGVERLSRLVAPRSLWRKTLSQSVAITVQSPVIRESARGYGIDPQVIANGVDTNRYRPRSDEERATLRRRLDLPEDRVLAICVGRYVPEKNQQVVIRAAEYLERENSGRLAVLILGATESENVASNEEELKTYVEDRGLETLVYFEDNIDNVEEYLGASDLFVFPSKYPEGMPNAVLEAMASGLPVLASDLPQVRCMFPEGMDNFFDPDDVVALAQQLDAMIENPRRRYREGEKLASWTREHYALSDQQSAYDSLLRSVASGPTMVVPSDSS